MKKHFVMVMVLVSMFLMVSTVYSQSKCQDPFSSTEIFKNPQGVVNSIFEKGDPCMENNPVYAENNLVLLLTSSLYYELVSTYKCYNKEQRTNVLEKVQSLQFTSQELSDFLLEFDRKRWLKWKKTEPKIQSYFVNHPKYKEKKKEIDDQGKDCTEFNKDR